MKACLPLLRKKGTGTVVRSTLRAVPATVPVLFLFSARDQEAGNRHAAQGARQ